MLLPDGNYPPTDSLASSKAQGGHFLKIQQGQMKVRNRHCQTTTRQKLRVHLFALTIASPKVGCCVKSSLCGLRHPNHAHFTALQGTHGKPRRNQVHFDSDSFPIGVDNHTSYCMVNYPHLLENLVLSKEGTVDGINEWFKIQGKGTFKFTIMDNNGRPHNIPIPNSLYLPGLKNCLLSPQHWAQKAPDNKTWMENFTHCSILH